MDDNRQHKIRVKTAQLYAQLGEETYEEALLVAQLLLTCLQKPREVANPEPAKGEPSLKLVRP